MARSSKSEPRLRVAVEISANCVIAARATRDGDLIEEVAIRTLPAGVVTLALAADNVHDHPALVRAVRDALSAVANRGSDVVLVLPDACTRVSLLDFDALPNDRKEAESIIRFRMKKALPFDVEHASVSYEVQRGIGGPRVVAALVLRSVLAEYESVVREAGFNPGVVVPAMAAAIGSVTTDRPTLVVKMDANTTGMAIVSDDNLLLLRTIETAAGAADLAQVAEDVYPSLVYFEDTYQMKVERLYVAGSLAQGLAPALEQATGIRPQELAPPSFFSAGANVGTDRALMGSVAGALIANAP